MGADPRAEELRPCSKGQERLSERERAGFGRLNFCGGQSFTPLPGGLTSRVRCIIGAWSFSRCCLIAWLATDSIASTKPSSAIARLHKRDPNAAKEFHSLAARWRVAAATRDFNHKVEDFCGAF